MFERPLLRTGVENRPRGHQLALTEGSCVECRQEKCKCKFQGRTASISLQVKCDQTVVSTGLVGLTSIGHPDDAIGMFPSSVRLSRSLAGHCVRANATNPTHGAIVQVCA